VFLLFCIETVILEVVVKKFNHFHMYLLLYFGVLIHQIKDYECTVSL